ncbi:Checkpoint protein hus1 [Microbotryomycetes sp. JL201]|nr:Checkpoint protein hus1 [Microbotryomycetes sp. JL201]
MWLLRAKSDEANVETEWRGLKHPQANDPESTSQDPSNPDEFHSVTVDSRNLLKFLAAHAIENMTISSLCQDHCAIFYVYIGDAGDDTQGGILTFFVPAINVGDDD